MTTTIHLPISCYELKYILLIGITVVFFASLYTVTQPIDNGIVLMLSIFGVVIGGLGSFMGWLIYFIEKNPIRIRCRCDT